MDENGVLVEAKDIVDSILDMTEDLVLTGQEEKELEEVESYALLMEEREPLVDRLTEIKKGIDVKMASSPQFAEIKAVIEKIAEIDKRHTEFMKGMNKKVLSSHKEIKTGQRLHNAYANINYSHAPSKFDAKQ